MPNLELALSIHDNALANKTLFRTPVPLFSWSLTEQHWDLPWWVGVRVRMVDMLPAWLGGTALYTIQRMRKAMLCVMACIDTLRRAIWHHCRPHWYMGSLPPTEKDVATPFNATAWALREPRAVFRGTTTGGVGGCWRGGGN